MNRKQAIGRWGENVAAEYLRNRGYEIVARNLRTPYGELDVIARKDGVIVFVEVKTRTGTSYGLPEGSVTPAKIAHLLDAARHFLQTNLENDCDWRVDVIAIQGRPNKPGVEIEWFQNAVS